MNLSKNKFYSKNKFFNYKLDKKNEIFYLWPIICFSKERVVDWTITVKTLFFCVFRYSFQINFFKINKNLDLKISKKEMLSILEMLRLNGFDINLEDVNCINKIMLFLNENFYLINLIKNSDISANYVKKIIISFFIDAGLIMQVK
jgi:hypothetical protein